ncbi:hypothetical protein [Microcoleus sp. F4-D5]|uniref:hypothetical protein n=1 Tax=Microcoleus sp. F4-D5 TaxID=2818760 RepID=UPI002FD5D1C9
MNQPYSRLKVNKQVGTNEGNIEVRVRVESKRQVLPVFGTLILLSVIKFIFILPLGGFVGLSVCLRQTLFTRDRQPQHY